MRTLTSISISSPNDLPRAFAAIYRAFFVNGNRDALATPAGFKPVLAEALGEKLAEKSVQESMTDRVKKAL